ncbi:oligosaccharide flippase family protein [Caballeronia sp. LZ062]|uniref:oligosaccharide flippase family protein n=1 Tax=unclassified Caballeronia TaxID=2646786 RepID=UPI00285AB91C|nr:MULTISPECIES: oligosaccharide flippase family protein [unclassified Caballeronia]MDR5855151.1 oligosaccharide flippase family protein [Caballeronia sp. LZ050]MDR5870319.1 oligosaccharide flippase family protein [Caballeronia sp. LZ062]
MKMLTRSGNPDVARALANIVWLGLERLTQIAVAIVISGLLARYLGPDAFGKWQYANTLLLVIAPITWVCGAEILVPTIVGKPPAETGAVLGSAFVLRMSVSIVALLLTWAWIALGGVDPLVGAMLAGLAVTMLFREPFIGVVNAWLQSMTYSKPQLIASMFTAIVKAALVYLLVRMAARASSFGWLWALEAAVIGAALVVYYMRRHGGTLGWRFDRTLFKHFASAGTVFWLGLICMYLFLKLDRLMLAHRVSFAELGLYSAAQQLNENWIALALMLSQTIAPAFVYRVQETPRLKRNLLRLFAMTAALMIAGAAVLDALAGFIIARVFGPNYVGAASIFRWAVWLSVPAGIEAIGNLVVLKFQARYVLLSKWLLALAVAFAVNAWAIPRFDGYGALVGLAAGYMAAASVNFYYIRFRLRA